MPEPLLPDKGDTCAAFAVLVGPPRSSSCQGARQARICPRGFLIGRCSASSAGRFPRTSLRVRRFADAGGVVDFGGKRVAGGTFGCSACDVCFMRSAQFSAGAELDEAEAHSARFAS